VPDIFLVVEGFAISLPSRKPISRCKLNEKTTGVRNMQLQKANTRVGRPILLLAQFLQFSIEQNLHRVKSSLG